MSFHWFRTVFWLIPTIAVYTILLGVASIASSLLDRRGYFAHGCARAWSWLILATTGVDVSVRGLERVVPGTPVETARHGLALELLADVQRLDDQLKDSHRRIRTAVAASQTSLTEIYGIGPIIACYLIGFTGDVRVKPIAGWSAKY